MNPNIRCVLSDFRLKKQIFHLGELIQYSRLIYSKLSGTKDAIADGNHRLSSPINDISKEAEGSLRRKTQVVEIQNSESISYRHVYHVPDSTK